MGKITLNISMEDASYKTIDKITVGYHFRSDVKNAELSDEWSKNKFPYVVQYWSDIKHLSLDEAYHWASEQRTANIPDAKIRLLGIDVDGKNLGAICPVIIIAMMIYIFLYVYNIRKFIIAQQEEKSAYIYVPTISPWIGAMRNVFSVFVSFITIVILPTTCVVVTLWRLNELAPKTIFIISSITFALGISIFICALCLSFSPYYEGLRMLFLMKKNKMQKINT